MATAPRPVLFLAAGASVLFTIALLVLVEIGAGFLVEPVHPQEIPGDAVSRTVTWLELNPAPLVRDVDLLWRNKPNARKTQLVNPMAFGRKDEWTIENNSDGFRGPELETPAPGEKAFRILCVGDSITFGFSVDQPHTYPRQLLDLLNARHPGRRFEIVNTGVPGWSWVQGLRFLDLRGPDLAPDLIVIGHGTNDQLFPSKITDEERFRRLSSTFAKTLQRVAAFAAETNTYRAFARGLPERPEDVESVGCKEQILHHGGCHRVSVDQIATAVHEVAKLSSDRGVAVLVANTDFVQTAAIDGVKRGVEQHGVPFVDLVAEANLRRKADEDARASRLGLEPAGDVTTVPATRKAVLRVLVPDPGREYRVRGTGYFRPQFAFAETMRDDGTGGDEKAGDGVFSVTLTVPIEIPALEYQYSQGDALEFAPVPPLASTLGDRVLHTPGSRIGPVDVFGQSLFMVERAHPNREGHQLIAQLIADKFEEMPAFREYVRGASGEDKPAVAGNGEGAAAR